MAKSSASTIEQVATVVRKSLENGTSVQIERLGTFRSVEPGRFEFVPIRTSSVFLAYVEEDRETAERLYEAIEKAGLSPWMDRRNLLPGQNWPRAIERSIELSDFFIPLLSRKSLVKRSMFQAEMRYALDCARRQPLESIYFIPVRLEECDVPWHISQHIQHLDLFPDFQRGAKRIVSMIRREESRRRG